MGDSSYDTSWVGCAVGVGDTSPPAPGPFTRHPSTCASISDSRNLTGSALLAEEPKTGKVAALEPVKHRRRRQAEKIADFEGAEKSITHLRTHNLGFRIFLAGGCGGVEPSFALEIFREAQSFRSSARVAAEVGEAEVVALARAALAERDEVVGAALFVPADGLMADVADRFFGEHLRAGLLVAVGAARVRLGVFGAAVAAWDGASAAVAELRGHDDSPRAQ